ncbi:MAG: hypothetical protein Q9169_006113 [Polycauliona sp. 2 TL-2023]
MNSLTSPGDTDRHKLRSQRSSSISNDRTSLSVVSMACPPPIEPDPAYIAASSASQIVTGDQEPGTTNALVAHNALLLLNAFLDQLLYSILAASRSTSIVALRPAVTEVLKPRLAKEAITSADEELQSFDGDNDELSAFHQELESRAGWDLNRIWRRTRLRCMVYTHLGDLEEQDEKIWLQRETDGQETDGQHRLSHDLGVVSPAAAIFLTSILEYIAEQALLFAAEAAYTRFEAQLRQESHDPADPADLQRLSVEVVDIEKLAVNTTFGRIWRSWKKRVRSPSMAKQRRSSHDYLLRPESSGFASDARSREPSVGEEVDQIQDARPTPAAADTSESVQEAAAAIPLPNTTYDAREIEGLEFPWQTSDGQIIGRPRSALLSSEPYQKADQYDEHGARGPRRELHRNRSSSLPPTTYGQYLDPQASLYSMSKEGMLPDESRTYPDGFSRSGGDAPAVMTMYDGAIAREEGATDNDQEYMTNDSRAYDEGYDTEAENLDKGLDSLVRGSIDSNDNTVDPAMHESGIPSRIDRSQDFTYQSSLGSNQDGVTGISRTQPWGVEDQLDSPRMQGHTTANVSLDNRETSIVETQPPQTAINRRDFPLGLDGANDEDDDYVPDGFGGSTSYGNGSKGPSYAQSGQSNGSMPRSLHEIPSNRVVAAGSPSPTFPYAKPSVKLSEIRKQLPPVSTGVERASVQRVSSSPASALESPVGRTSTSSSRELRAIHTSGSGTSQTANKSKALGARGSSDTSRQYAVSRRSSEASNVLTTPLVKTPEVDETQRSFEQLIKSDETIQYTLTPQSVRETDSIDSPRGSHSRTETADLADFIRSGPPPAAAEMGRPVTSRSIVSLKGLNGLRSNPTASSRSPVSLTMAPFKETPKPQSPPSRPATARSAKGGPRKAQSESESTRDFADFIRSTGPDEMSINDPRKDMAVVPPANKPRPTKAMSPEQRTASAASTGIGTGRKITKPNPGLSFTPPPPVSPPAAQKQPVKKFEAREPTYGPTNSNGLLSFLQNGPPLDDKDVGKRQGLGPIATIVPINPRVPTNLRNRLSDNTQSSAASTQDSGFVAQSIRSQNSRTGLLDSSRGSNGGSPPLSQKTSRFNEPPQAARKQRRVKDPYAIDTDSEDDSNDKTPKAHPQEESLIDFLNSTPPLSDPKPIIPSAFDDIPNPTARSNAINKKAMDKYNARTSASATPGIRSAAQAPTSSPPKRGRPTAPSTQPPQLPPLSSRAISPILMPSATSTNGTTPPRKVNKPPGPARSDREDNTRGMSDLADFLRNSEPPTQVPREMMVPPASGEDKETEGKGLWGRWRKKRGR